MRTFNDHRNLMSSFMAPVISKSKMKKFLISIITP